MQGRRAPAVPEGGGQGGLYNKGVGMEGAAAMYCSGCSCCCRSWWWLSLWRPLGGHDEPPCQQGAAPAQAGQPYKPKPSYAPASSPPLLLLRRKPLPLPRPCSHHGRIRYRRRRAHLARASVSVTGLPSRTEATVAFPSPPLAAPHRVMNPGSSWSLSGSTRFTAPSDGPARTAMPVCGSIVGMCELHLQFWLGFRVFKPGVSTVMLDTLLYV